MIHIFHGFLGSPADFSFLQSHQEIVFHDLYSEDLTLVKLGAEDTLIGYSMGGRAAMEIASRHHFNMKKLVVINAHPGIEDAQKSERSLWEESVIDRLQTLSQDKFLSYWNSLPLFAGDQPLNTIHEDRFKKSWKIFKQFRLSQQKCFLPELSAHKDKVLWLAGSKDPKYAEIAKAMIEPLGIRTLYMNGGHRLYQHPQELQKILSEQKVL